MDYYTEEIKKLERKLRRLQNATAMLLTECNAAPKAVKKFLPQIQATEMALLMSGYNDYKAPVEETETDVEDDD